MFAVVLLVVREMSAPVAVPALRNSSETRFSRSVRAEGYERDAAREDQGAEQRDWT